MKKLIIKSNLLLLLILLIGLLLRINNYTNEPPRGASSDEYTYSFLGLSLLEKGVPTSWSYFPAYSSYAKTSKLTINHIYFPIVTPYFDHPPLYGILVGGWAMINGETTYNAISLKTIRQVPILLGMVTSLLVYLLALKLYGKKTALWALLIYSTATIFVIETRTVFAENLFTPLLLGSILLISSVKKRVSYKLIISLGLIAGLSLWVKELGIVVFISSFCLLLMQKVSYRKLILLSFIFIVFGLLYLLYGYIYNWELFKQIVFVQSSREIGPNTLYMLFFNPISVNKKYLDGWYLLGFVSFFASFINFEKNKFLLIPSFLYLFLCMFFLTSKAEMGWYMIPLFPFFAIFTSNLLVDGIKNKNWYIFVATLFIGMFATQYRIEAKYGLSSPTFRLILLLLFVPLLLSSILKKNKLFVFLSNSWFYFLIFLTILITYRYIHPL